MPGAESRTGALQLAVAAAEPELFAGKEDGVFLRPVEQEEGKVKPPPGLVARSLARIEIATAGTRHFAADVYLGEYLVAPPRIQTRLTRMTPRLQATSSGHA